MTSIKCKQKLGSYCYITIIVLLVLPGIIYFIITSISSPTLKLFNVQSVLDKDVKHNNNDIFESPNLEHSINLNPNLMVLPITSTSTRNASDTDMNDMINWSNKPDTFCFGNDALKDSETVIVSISDVDSSKHDDLLTLSRLNKVHYGFKHNYVYCEFPANPQVGKHSIWGRLGALINVLKLYKYAIWIDLDVVMLQNSRSFEHLLNLFTNNEAIYAVLITDLPHSKPEIVNRDQQYNIDPLVSDPPFFYSVNTGIMIYKSHNKTFNFIQEWSTYYNDKISDQDALKRHYYHHQMFWNEHIKIVNFHDIQLFIRKPKRKDYEHDTHLWHIAGGHWTWNKKQTELRDYLLKAMDTNVMWQHSKHVMKRQREMHRIAQETLSQRKARIKMFNYHKTRRKPHKV